MTTPELLVLSLAFSVLVAAAGLFVLRALDGRLADATLREKAWGLAFHVSALPPLLVGVCCLVPAPRVVAPIAAPIGSALSEIAVSPSAGLLPEWNMEAAVVAVLALAACLAILRLGRLGWRTVRLHRLVRASVEVDEAVREQVGAAAGRFGIAPPRVRVGPGGHDVLLAGLFRPTLIVPPAVLDRCSDTIPAWLAHELAHLKRGDLRALWVEEAVVAILAVNPLLPLIRAGRAAAREEACDALALGGADAETRRRYARSLLDALRAASSPARVPALAFVSRKRSFAMRRLKSVLTPANPAGSRTRMLVAGIGVAVASAAGAGSLALAAEREPVVTASSTPDVVTAASASEVSSRTPIAAELSSADAAVARPDPLAASEALVSGEDLKPTASAASTAPAASAPIFDPVQSSAMTNPSWARRPAPMTYPEAALADHVSPGRATLSCLPNADGTFSSCEIVAEEPAGYGFGAAAMQAAMQARLSEEAIQRLEPGKRVRWSTTFTMAQPE